MARSSIVQPGCTKLSEMPKEQFRREVEKELTGRETEPWEIIYFKLYKSQIPIIEQALETAALMLGSDRSRGYCLEMICADFLAGANLDSGDPDMLLRALSSSFKFLPQNQRQAFLQIVNEQIQSSRLSRKRHRSGSSSRLPKAPRPRTATRRPALPVVR